MFTNDPVADFHSYDAEQQMKLEQLPVCGYCGYHIQDEKCLDVEGELYHVECFEREHLKWTDDYV